MANIRSCTAPDCSKPQKAKGFCNAHYNRLLRGEPLTALRPKKGALLDWIAGHKGHEGATCLPWPFAKDHNGYGLVRYRGIHTGAHRVMCIEAHGEPPSPDHETAHSCGKGGDGCVHPKHLSWKTTIENHQDKVAHGTVNRGEEQHCAKLSPAKVREIRALKGRVLQKDLAARFGVHVMQISRIQAGLTWAWVE